MTCFMTPAGIYRDLVGLFRRNCPDGSVIFLAHSSSDVSSEADILVAEGDKPDSLIEKLRARIVQPKADRKMQVAEQ